MARGKQVRRRHLTFSAGRELSDADLSFLRIVSMGNLPKVREILESADTAGIESYLQMTDYKDRTALELATEAEHSEIVEYLVEHYLDVMDELHVHECLMLSISKGYFRITELLLDSTDLQTNKHRGYRSKHGQSTFYMTKNNSKFNRDLTPIMLAAQCNEVDIIRLFLGRGDCIAHPHPDLCSCIECMEHKADMDPLMRSLASLHTYQALASEAYICLTSPDPILTAFLLSERLTKLAATEKEFKNEYRELVKQCKQFASDLLDMCQTTEEVRTILKQEATTEIMSHAAEGALTLRKRSKTKGPEQDEKIDNDFALPRLELAIRYLQKQFVAHPHCQHHLATLWYKGTPSKTRQWPTIVKCFTIVAVLAALPIMSLIYWIYPRGQLAKFMHSPRTKFLMQATMYVLFLAILFLESVVSQDFRNDSHLLEFMGWAKENCSALYVALNNQKIPSHSSILRAECVSPLQCTIIVFVAGMLWAEIKQMYSEGYRHYLASMWNWIDIFMLNFLIASLGIQLVVALKVEDSIDFFRQMSESCDQLLHNHTDALEHLYWLKVDRSDWREQDPTLVAEALFAVANVLSFPRLYYILPVNEFLGPLQISLGRMMGQIVRFGAVFIVVFMAFFCALTNLYWYYPENSKFGTYDEALKTLFWALFGLGDTGDVALPRDENCRGGNKNVDHCSQNTTEIVGTTLYILYHLSMVIVLLNMLIAMMTTSFQEIHDDEDVEWKFARSRLWISYFDSGATLPIPFNLIPSPKSVYYAFRYIKKFFCPTFSCKKDRHHLEKVAQQLPVGMQHLNRRAGVRKQVSTHESLMKTVIKRYLFKLQNDKDGEDGAEGELEEIKNDISSFRCEVMERLKSMNSMSSPMNTAPVFVGTESVFNSAFRRETSCAPAASHEALESAAVQRRMGRLEERVEELVDAIGEFFTDANDVKKPSAHEQGASEAPQQLPKAHAALKPPAGLKTPAALKPPATTKGPESKNSCVSQ